MFTRDEHNPLIATPEAWIPDDWMIEELRREEREREERERPFLELPLPIRPPAEESQPDHAGDRGVVIIEL